MLSSASPIRSTLSPSRAPGKVTVKAEVSTRVGFIAVHLAVTRWMFAVIKQANETLHAQLPHHAPPQATPAQHISFLGPTPLCSPTLHPQFIQMACGCWEPTTLGNGLFHNLLQALSLTTNPLETFSNKSCSRSNRKRWWFQLCRSLTSLLSLAHLCWGNKKRRPPAHSWKCHQSPACLGSGRVIVLLATELPQLSISGARTASQQPGASSIARRT